MATIKAAASGNWSAPGTWTGGVVPSLNDTVYANGFTVALDQSIDLTGSTVDTSGSFIPGQIYMIVSLGTTNFALTANCIAPGTNAGTPVAITSAVGQIFQAVNAGTATTGTARRMGALLNYVNTPLTIATGGSFTMAASYNITGAYIQAGSANCLTISGSASPTLTNCRATGSAGTASTRAIVFSSSGTMTISNMTATGGRVIGTNSATGAHAVENSGGGGIVISNSTLTMNAAFAAALNNNSTGTVSFNECSIGGNGAVSAYAVSNNAAGILSFTASTISGGGGSYGSYGVWNNASGNINISGSSVFGGTTDQNAGIYLNGGGIISISAGSTISGNTGGSSAAITNGASATINISSSSITGGTSTNVGINLGAGVLSATNCTVTAGAGVNARAITTTSAATINVTGDITSSNAANAINSTNASAIIRVSGSLISSPNGMVAVNCPKFLIDPTPTTAKFRQAKNGSTTYSDFFTADNNLGQAAVADVRTGTVYANGNLTGTCAVPAAGSVSLGVPVDAGFGTAVLTPAAIRSELSVELGRIDAAISSRLAPSGTLATVTTLTDAPIVPTAAAIASQVRTELSSELAKVSALNPTRLSQVTTTEILGNLLSQANS
jgi:hypothetical protein